MSVRIRLQRLGSHKSPSYRIVVMDSRKPRNSTPIEYIGNYYPVSEKNAVSIKTDRLNYWVGRGAIPSERVTSILKEMKENTPTVTADRNA